MEKSTRQAGGGNPRFGCIVRSSEAPAGSCRPLAREAGTGGMIRGNSIRSGEPQKRRGGGAACGSGRIASSGSGAANPGSAGRVGSRSVTPAPIKKTEQRPAGRGPFAAVVTAARGLRTGWAILGRRSCLTLPCGGSYDEWSAPQRRAVAGGCGPAILPILPLMPRDRVAPRLLDWLTAAVSGIHHA